MVRALGCHGSGDASVRTAACAQGLESLARAARSSGDGGAEALGEALQRAGVVPQLEAFWDASRGATVRAAVMALCAALVQLPGLAATLVDATAEGAATLRAAAACAAKGPPGEEGEAQWCAAIAGWRRGLLCVLAVLAIALRCSVRCWDLSHCTLVSVMPSETQ